MGVLSKGLEGAKALLDMSRKARMERAREMGFDTERVLYHGSPTLDESGAFDASFPRRTDEGYMGVGAYVTPKRFIADAYAGRDGNTLELLSRSSRPLAVPYDESYRQRLKDIADGWGVDVQDVDSPEWAQEFRARAIENGYDSVVGVAPDTGEAIEMVVYDPAMLRSVNAAFDPAKRDSSNLLAGVGGAAVGAGLLAPQEADAGVGSRVLRKLYRAETPGDTRRIQTSDEGWDSHLFAASDPAATAYYGDELYELDVSPDARVLFEGSREFRSLAKGTSQMNALERSAEVARRAQAAGYDAVHFKQQGNIGTAVLNPDIIVGRRHVGSTEKYRGGSGFARPGTMAAAGAGGAVAAYDPVEARQTARRRREIDGLVDTMLEDFRRSAAAPRPDTPRFETLAQLAEWARAQRTVGMPLYGQPLAGTADTLERLAYGEYRPGREGLGTLAMDAATTAAEVLDPGTWASLGRQAQQDLINQLSDWRTRANR